MQIFDDVEESVEASARLDGALPAGEEAGEGALFDGLDFFAEFGERLAADGAEDFCVDPFAIDAAGAEASFGYAA